MLCFVSHFNEAVCSRDDPAWRDESCTTEETVSSAKYSSDPRVRLYGCERTTHDFMHPPLRPLTACQLCRDTQDESVSADEGNHKITLRKSAFKQQLPVSTTGGGFTVGVEPVWEQKTEIIRKIKLNQTIFQ